MLITFPALSSALHTPAQHMLKKTRKEGSLFRVWFCSGGEGEDEREEAMSSLWSHMFPFHGRAFLTEAVRSAPTDNRGSLPPLLYPVTTALSYCLSQASSSSETETVICTPHCSLQRAPFKSLQQTWNTCHPHFIATETEA